MDAQRGSPAMVTDCQYTNALTNDPIKKMKRESVKIHTADIALTNRVTFRRCDCLTQKCRTLPLIVGAGARASASSVLARDAGKGSAGGRVEVQTQPWR